MANVTMSCRHTVTKIRACMVDGTKVGIAVGSKGYGLSGKDESVWLHFCEKNVQF